MEAADESVTTSSDSAGRGQLAEAAAGVSGSEQRAPDSQLSWQANESDLFGRSLPRQSINDDTPVVGAFVAQDNTASTFNQTVNQVRLAIAGASIFFLFKGRTGQMIIFCGWVGSGGNGPLGLIAPVCSGGGRANWPS